MKIHTFWFSGQGSGKKIEPESRRISKGGERKFEDQTPDLPQVLQGHPRYDLRHSPWEVPRPAGIWTVTGQTEKVESRTSDANGQKSVYRPVLQVSLPLLPHCLLHLQRVPEALREQPLQVSGSEMAARQQQMWPLRQGTSKLFLLATFIIVWR